MTTAVTTPAIGLPPPLVSPVRAVILAALAAHGVTTPFPAHRVEAYLYHHFDEVDPGSLAEVSWHSLQQMLKLLVRFVTVQEAHGADPVFWDRIARDQLLDDTPTVPFTHPALTTITPTDTLGDLRARVLAWNTTHA